ncbi:MAG: glycosyltransferase family 9 protein [Bryobacteraceae bacterium]
MTRLLIRPGGIGDSITCFPAMEWLRADYTEVWVPSAIVPLVQFADRVRSISSTGIELLGVGELEAPVPLRESLAEFGDIVTWYGSNRSEFREAAHRLNPNWRFLAALPAKDSALQATDFYAEQIGAPLGLVPCLQTPPHESRATVVIHPFSGGRSKNWPLPRFRELAEALPLPVEWTAGPEEDLPEARRFENLFELACWIRGAALFIGNDSGVTHLAAATGVPTVGLYGESNAKTWRARGERMIAVPKPSVEEIRVIDVLDAAKAVLSHPTGERHFEQRFDQIGRQLR